MNMEKDGIKFTHLAKIYGFKCYFNIDNHEVKGTNWFNDMAIFIFAYLATEVFNHEGFRIELIREL